MNIKNDFLKEHKQVTIIIIISFVAVFFMVIMSNHFGILFSGFRLEGFEEGKVAPRDLVADHNYTFTDSKATEELIIEKLSMAFPVFKLDNEKINIVLSDFYKFSQEYLSYKESSSRNEKANLYAELSQLFELEEIKFLLDDVDPYVAIPTSSDLLEDMLDEGIVKIPDNFSVSDFEKIQVWRWKSGRKQFNIIDSDSLLTMIDIDKIVEEKLIFKKLGNNEKYAIHLIVNRFIRENVFFDEIQTELNYDRIKIEVEPVIEQVHSGDHVIRSGFIVTAKDMEKAKVLNTRAKYINIRQISAAFLYCMDCRFATFICFQFLCFIHCLRKKSVSINIFIC